MTKIKESERILKASKKKKATNNTQRNSHRAISPDFSAEIADGKGTDSNI